MKTQTPPLLIALALGIGIAAGSTNAAPRENAKRLAAPVATGTWSREATGTTPAGKTWSHSIEGQRTDDGFVRTETRTGPGGATLTRNTVAVRNADGSLSKDVTHTVTPPQNGTSDSE